MNGYVKVLLDTLPKIHQTREVEEALSRAFELGRDQHEVIERHYDGDLMGGGTGMHRSTIALTGTKKECAAYITDHGGEDVNYCPEGPRYFIRAK